MEDVSCRTVGTGIGDLVVVADVARCEQIGIARDGDTNGGDKVFALAASVPAASCSELRSSRIENMMSSRSEFETELEFRTAHSKVHWSELSYERASGSEDESGLDHRHYFETLQKDVHWGPFCSRVQDVVLGRKLGEGAQAEIYEAEVLFVNEDGSLGSQKHCGNYVVKVMKGDCALQDLQCQWPHGIVKPMGLLVVPNLCGALVTEPATERNKFGFVMRMMWGDLRSLIDLRMERNNAQGPPFYLLQAEWMMYWIARDMAKLHKRGIIHRDLKTSNVLVSKNDKMEHDIVSSRDMLNVPIVADYECSMDVVGTGFWRAPEILQQLKDRTPSSELVFNEKADVYGFAMTCYEIVTGLIPFEGLLYNSELRDAVLSGSRPKLPHDLDLKVRAMITSCWDSNPSLRPSFDKIPILLDLWGFF